MAKPNYKITDIKDIAGCFEKLHMNMNNEFSELKEKFGKLEVRVDNIVSHVVYANVELSKLHNKYIPDLEDRIDTVVKKEQTEKKKLEMWGREWNLVIRGIADKEGEDTRQTVLVVRKFLSETLNISEDTAVNMIFTAAHRLKGGPDDKKSIIVRLSNFMDRDDILRAAQTKLAPDTGYSVMPDLPPTVAQRRNELFKERSEMEPMMKRNFKIIYTENDPFVRLYKRDKRQE